MIATLRRLARDVSGVSILELALSLPVLVTLGMMGAEMAWLAIVNLQVSQVSTGLADNASRLGQSDNSAVTPTVTESQVASVLAGALASGLSLESRGRVILSSLEEDRFTGRQFIHWQRCMGALDVASRYGPEGTGLGGKVLAGLGRDGHLVTALPGSAVMYAEVVYEHDGLFGAMFSGNRTLRHEAAFLVRDDRNLMSSEDGTPTPGLTGADAGTRCE